MSLQNIFSFKAEKLLAQELVSQLSKELPPKLMEERRKVLSANKITRLLERAFNQALTHQAASKMGFIKRAVLANNFKWELKSVGYPADFVDMATEGLVVELSKAKKSTGPTQQKK